MFGSYIYNPLKSRDVDLLVILKEETGGIKEYVSMSIELSMRLRKSLGARSYDVTVMDVEMFAENVQPGAFLSGAYTGL